MLKRVAYLRKVLSDMREDELLKQELLEQTLEWQDLDALRKEIKKIREELAIEEDIAREEIIKAWDGKTKKGEGWGIRVMRRVQYDLETATEWARENLPGALVLDKRVFEKTAPLVGGPVEVVEEVTATIASDLSFLD